MIKPAILYKDEITRMCQENFYTEAMLFETGSNCNWCPHISEEPDERTFQFAITNGKNKLLGFICYNIDWYSDKAFNFGMLSNQKANALFAKEVFRLLEDLVAKHHRVEWRMVGGNPVEKHYDKFCFAHGGNKHILKDSIKDKNGNYRDDIIYEIVK